MNTRYLRFENEICKREKKLILPPKKTLTIQFSFLSNPLNIQGIYIWTWKSDIKIQSNTRRCQKIVKRKKKSKINKKKGNK